MDITMIIGTVIAIFLVILTVNFIYAMLLNNRLRKNYIWKNDEKTKTIRAYDRRTGKFVE